MGTSARAADYHVSAAGNDAGPGTLAQPWQTIDRVNSTALAAGDRILFKGGETFAGTINLDAGDLGTATNPVVIGSYGTGRATIDAGNDTGIIAYNVAGVDIEDLIFIGSGAATNSGVGIAFYADLPGSVKLERINIDNVEVSGFGEGVTIGSWSGSTGYRDVSVTNSLLHDNAQHGLSTYAFTKVTNAHENVYVGAVKTYNQTGLASKTTVGGKSHAKGSGIVLGGVDGGIVEHCEAWNNGALNTSADGPAGIWTYNANNIVIQHNESYGNRTKLGDGGGFGIDGGVTNSVIQYNSSHDNDGAGYLFAQYRNAPHFASNIIRYNVSENDARKGTYDGGINVWGYNGTFRVTDSQIHDNVIIMSPAAGGGALKGIYLFGSYSGITVSNNTIITSGGMSLVQADGAPTTENALFQCNEYWPSNDPFMIRWGTSAYTSLAEFIAGESGQEVCAE